MVEVSILTELKQQLVKENMVGEISLSTVRDGFYADVVSYMNEIDSEACKIMFAKFKRGRVTKLSRLACARISVDDIKDKLAPEEQVLYLEMLEAVDKYWRLY